VGKTASGFFRARRCPSNTWRLTPSARSGAHRCVEFFSRDRLAERISSANHSSFERVVGPLSLGSGIKLTGRTISTELVRCVGSALCVMQQLHITLLAQMSPWAGDIMEASNRAEYG